MKSPLDQLHALTEQVPQLLAEAAPVVAVVGDVMLDGWWHGDIERFCREAPAPVVEVRERSYAPGGAANTAMNAARLGGAVRMLGLVGRDRAGIRLRQLLEQEGIDTSALVEHEQAATTTKDRIIGGDQILFRLDEQSRTVPAEALQAVADRVAAAVKGADVVVVCDYDSGMLRGQVHDALVAELADRDPDQLVIIDAHDPRPWAALVPDLATPNAQEALGLLGWEGQRPQDRVALLRERHTELLAQTGSRAVVVTLDQEGTVYFTASGREHRTWARPVTEKQASGAGDTFVAALSLGCAAGLPRNIALELAQAAATVVVHRPGTSVCSTADLRAHLGGASRVHFNTGDLAQAIARHREDGQSVVLTNGCFDVLHRGHTSYLEQAKELGDVLVVALNSDESVRRLKGEGRPVNPVADRAAVIEALSCVDYVTVFDSDTPVPLIQSLQPEIYAKGGDYTEQMLAESASVREYGGQVRILDYVSDHSTTGLLRRMSQQGAAGNGAAAQVAEQSPEAGG